MINNAKMPLKIFLINIRDIFKINNIEIANIGITNNSVPAGVVLDTISRFIPLSIDGKRLGYEHEPMSNDIPTGILLVGKEGFYPTDPNGNRLLFTHEDMSNDAPIGVVLLGNKKTQNLNNDGSIRK